jgi:hypothetical protein
MSFFPTDDLQRLEPKAGKTSSLVAAVDLRSHSFAETPKGAEIRADIIPTALAKVTTPEANSGWTVTGPMTRVSSAGA